MQIPLRDKLAFPAGVAPGFDPTHIAAQGAQLSAVFSGGNFLNVAPGFCSLLGTISGTPASVLDGALGPAKNVGTSYSVAFGSSAPAISGSVTMAAIIRVPATSNSGILHNASAASTGGTVLACFANNLYLANLAATTDINSGVQIATGDPYFVAASLRGGVQVDFVAANLRTGQIQTATVTTTVNASATGSGFTIGEEYEYGTFFNGKIAAVMAAAGYVPLSQLLAWARDPWSFWYPDAAADKYSIATIPQGVGFPLASMALFAKSIAAGVGRLGLGGLAAVSARSAAQGKANAAMSPVANMAAKSIGEAKGALGITAKAAMLASSLSAGVGKMGPMAGKVSLAAKSMAAALGRLAASGSGGLVSLFAASVSMAKGSLLLAGRSAMQASSNAQAKGLAGISGKTALSAKSAAMGKGSAQSGLLKYLTAASIAMGKGAVAMKATAIMAASSISAGSGKLGQYTGKAALSAISKAAAYSKAGIFVQLPYVLLQASSLAAGFGKLFIFRRADRSASVPGTNRSAKVTGTKRSAKVTGSQRSSSVTPNQG